MQPGMKDELRRLLLLGSLAALIGLTLDLVLEILFFASLAYLLWTIQRMAELRDWVTHGMKERPPETDTIAGEIVDALTRSQRRDVRRQRQLRYRIKRFSMMTEALEEGLVVLDRDLILSWWNPAAGMLMGLRSADQGSAIVNLVREPAFVEYLHRAEFTEPLEMISPIRRDQTLQFTAAKFGEGETVLVVWDISRLRALEGLRREFVGNVSHELRTPLTVLRGYVETLAETEEDPAPELRRAYDQMSVQIERMQSLADDLVLLARLESDDYKRERHQVDLAELLSEICREADHVSKGLHAISLVVEPGLTLEGNRRELYSGLSNLVLNAVRHNPEGANITVEASDQSSGVLVKVKDDGIGIDHRYQSRLTERFYRVDSSRGRATGGTGLGLAIVKHVLQQHNATLSIDSRLGRGSTFSCHFPRSEDAIPAQVNA